MSEIFLVFQISQCVNINKDYLSISIYDKYSTSHIVSISLFITLFFIANLGFRGLVLPQTLMYTKFIVIVVVVRFYFSILE